MDWLVTSAAGRAANASESSAVAAAAAGLAFLCVSPGASRRSDESNSARFTPSTVDAAAPAAPLGVVALMDDALGVMADEEEEEEEPDTVLVLTPRRAAPGAKLFRAMPDMLGWCGAKLFRPPTALDGAKLLRAAAVGAKLFRAAAVEVRVVDGADVEYAEIFDKADTEPAPKADDAEVIDDTADKAADDCDGAAAAEPYWSGRSGKSATTKLAMVMSKLESSPPGNKADESFKVRDDTDMDAWAHCEHVPAAARP